MFAISAAVEAVDIDKPIIPAAPKLLFLGCFVGTTISQPGSILGYFLCRKPLRVELTVPFM